MSKVRIETLALALILGSLPLVSVGAVGGVGVLWGAGLIMLAAGGIAAVGSRYAAAGRRAGDGSDGPGPDKSRYRDYERSRE